MFQEYPFRDSSASGQVGGGAGAQVSMVGLHKLDDVWKAIRTGSTKPPSDFLKVLDETGGKFKH